MIVHEDRLKIFQQQLANEVLKIGLHLLPQALGLKERLSNAPQVRQNGSKCLRELGDLKPRLMQSMSGIPAHLDRAVDGELLDLIEAGLNMNDEAAEALGTHLTGDRRSAG